MDFNCFIPDVCLYHSISSYFPCPDGIASAYVVWLKYIQKKPDLKFMGCCYDGPDPELGIDVQNVLIVDFSFSEEIIYNWQQRGINVVIIDHHEGFKQKLLKSKSFNLEKVFIDLNECGATYTFKLLFPGEEMPVFLEYIRDRDLFIKELPYTDYIHAAMQHLGRTFKTFDELRFLDQETLIEVLKPLGEKSVKTRQEKIAKYLTNPKKVFLWKSQNVSIPVIIVNKSDIYFKSDLARTVLEKYSLCDFCVVLIKDNLIDIRVRCAHDSTDLIALFADYGATGHKGAATFKWDKSLEDLKDLVLNKAEELESLKEDF